MSVSGVSQLSNLIPEMWAQDMYDELRKRLVIAPVFERKYEGEIRNMGDLVRVNQVVAPTGEILTSDTDVFNPELLQTNQFTIQVNKRAVASFEITDTALLQSMDFQAQAQEALVYSIQKQMEDDIISELSSNVSTSAPDHDVAPASASDLAAADIAEMRRLLSVQSVPTSPRFLFLDPSYFSDLLLKSQFTSSDFVGGGQPTNSAEFRSPLYGFNVAESDNLSADEGYAVHPSALQVVMQQDVRIKTSDLHNQKKFGLLLSADILYGIQVFDNKRYVKISG